MDFPGTHWTRNLPSTDEVLRAIGFESRHSAAADMLPSVALFGAGMLVGAVLALLFAPSSGEALRSELSERAAQFTQSSGSDAERPNRTQIERDRRATATG